MDFEKSRNDGLPDYLLDFFLQFAITFYIYYAE